QASQPDLARINESFALVPHNRALGITVVSATWQPAAMIARLPWHAQLVGNPDGGSIHGGVVTTFLDAVGGGAVYLRMAERSAIATLDLRIDYLKPAAPQRDVFTRAECIKVTRNVAFVRTVAYQDEDDPIALGSATYMVSTKGKAVIAP